MERVERIPLHDLARQRWDVLIIGGGITGAGVFREAAALGLRILLVEASDFASGTSSHSAKLIHGGLHYLSRLQLGLARESIRERDCLLREGAGLVEPLDFVLPVVPGNWKQRCVNTAGLGIYHAIGGRFPGAPPADRHILDQVAPGLDCRYRSAHRYLEGQTDDARLTLRVIAAGRNEGGVARNYTRACGLIRNCHGQVSGAELCDALNGETAPVTARHVVNATGPWSDAIRAGIARPSRQRIVRGSHLVFPHHRLPVRSGVVAYHHESGLPIYILPWRGVTLAGTTHVDSGTAINWPCIASAEEVTYLLDGVQALFTGLQLEPGDIQATYAGYRPIVDTRTADPAHASRDYDIWVEDGLVTVAGGKLTTHRSVARHVMRAILPRLPRWTGVHPSERALCDHSGRVTSVDLPEVEQHRLASYFGPEAIQSILAMSETERQTEPELPGFTLAELRWAARAESVVHLDDLLSRRFRLALQLPGGGQDRLGSFEPIVRQELGWDRDRWQREVDRYLAGWAERYAVPPITGAPASRQDVHLSDAA